MAPSVIVDGLWEGYRPGRRKRLPWRGMWHWALRDIDLIVEPGEIVGVVGRNGSGKTTLLQSVAGIIPPTRGSVITGGRVASLVDLHAGFHRDLTGHENLLIGGVLLGLSRKQVRQRYDAIVDFTGIDDEALATPLSTFSTGMGLRLGFSLIVHSDPAILVVDEVLAVGDEAFQERCIDRVEEMVSAGCALLLASHDLELVHKHCHRLTVLHDGEQRYTGEVAEGIDRYRAMQHGHEDFGPHDPNPPDLPT